MLAEYVESSVPGLVQHKCPSATSKPAATMEERCGIPPRHNMLQCVLPRAD